MIVGVLFAAGQNTITWILHEYVVVEWSPICTLWLKWVLKYVSEIFCVMIVGVLFSAGQNMIMYMKKKI